MRMGFYGQPLAEVFSVRIDNMGTEDLILFGKIGYCDSLFSEYIYKRKSNDCETIRPGGMCTLTGPSKCILADDHICFRLGLWNSNRLSPYNEVIRGEFVWSSYSTWAEYDTHLIKKVNSIYGSWTVDYAVHLEAVQAYVEVMLINCGGKDTANVYGQLWACGNLFQKEILLFSRKSDKYINVKAGDRIPLLRSAVVVSLESSLTVRAELGYEGEIVEDKVEFQPEPGTYTKNISGKIDVKVTWSRR